MNPFFFGRSQQPLFGIYHPAKGNDRGMGVVLCPPIGQEYMRTHRALRQLALQLAKAGLHVLRFDFSGLGDSAGDNTDASIAAWSDDIATAIDELKDSAGVRTVSVVGIRIAAAMACLAARERSDVDSLVLWDPVVAGADYLAELLALADVPGHAPAGETIGVTGFALTAAFRSEIAGIDLCAVARHGAKRTMLVVSEERADYARLRAHLAAWHAPSTYACLPSGASWDDAEQMGAVLLPQAIIQAIVGHVAA